MYVPQKFAGRARQPQQGVHTLDAAVQFAKEQIGARALDRIGPNLSTELYNAGVLEFHIFGGALLAGAPNDIDLGPAKRTGEKFEALAQRLKKQPDAQYGAKLLDGVMIQFCVTTPTELKSLVDTFDFAHCKVGATLTRDKYDCYSALKVKEVYLAPEFIAAMLTQGTFYTEGQWPMRSLARVAKVGQKLGLNQDEIHTLALQVVAHIHEKGLDEVLEGDSRFVEFLTKND